MLRCHFLGSNLDVHANWHVVNCIFSVPAWACIKIGQFAHGQ